MLMAAGLGTRMRPFTESLPKALTPVMGNPVAQYSMDLLRGTGVRKVVANVHHHSEKAIAGLGGLDLGDCEMRFSDESQKLLGSAGGVRKALPWFEDEPFFYLNADVLCHLDLKALEAAHLRLRRAWGVKMTLTVFPSGPGGGSYREIVFDSREGRMKKLGEFSTGKPFFVGAAVMEPEAFEHLPYDEPSEFVAQVLMPALQEGKVGVYLAKGPWHDIGSPLLWHQAHLALLDGAETGALPAAWSSRIEQCNQRIAQKVWVNRGFPRRLKSRTEWVGPSYWNIDPLASSAYSGSIQLGPGAVLYGASAISASQSRVFERGIGMGNHWIGF